jgi:hypothetical protein
MCRPQSSRHIPCAVHKVVGTFHVPSTWNPGKCLTANGTAERACTFCPLCQNHSLWVCHPSPPLLAKYNAERPPCLVPLIGINVAQETTRSQALRQSLGTKHIGMSLRVKQTDSRRAIAPVLDKCRLIGKPGLSPNG